MTKNDLILQRLSEIDEQLEMMVAELDRLQNAIPADDWEAEIMVDACSFVKSAIYEAHGKTYDEISDTRRYLKNARSVA